MSNIIIPVQKNDGRTVAEVVQAGRFTGKIINGRIVLVPVK